MHPIKRLQKLFAPTGASSQGAVTKVGADVIEVATAQGLKVLRRADRDGTHYRVGDTVRISGDQVAGRSANTGDVYPV